MKTQNPAKWTKKELAALRSTMNSYLVICRERYGRHPEFAKLFAAHIEGKRKEIVIAGLRDDTKIHRESAERHRQFAEHCRAHPHVYGTSNEETIARSEGYAKDDEKILAWYDRLIARIKSEDLPPEIANFNPLNG